MQVNVSLSLLPEPGEGQAPWTAVGWLPMWREVPISRPGGGCQGAGPLNGRSAATKGEQGVAPW